MQKSAEENRFANLLLGKLPANWLYNSYAIYALLILIIATIHDKFEYTLDVGTIDIGNLMAEYLNITGEGTIIYQTKEKSSTLALQIDLKFEGITLNCKEFEDRKLLPDSPQFMKELQWAIGVAMTLPKNRPCVLL